MGVLQGVGPSVKAWRRCSSPWTGFGGDSALPASISDSPLSPCALIGMSRYKVATLKPKALKTNASLKTKLETNNVWVMFLLSNLWFQKGDSVTVFFGRARSPCTHLLKLPTTNKNGVGQNETPASMLRFFQIASVPVRELNTAFPARTARFAREFVHPQ